MVWKKLAYTAEEAGFVITSIDAGPFALARLFSDTNQAQTEAVVNISGNGTDVIVLNTENLPICASCRPVPTTCPTPSPMR